MPALAAACSSWQKCAAKDPAIVGRARVAAETVAEIVNGFVDVVSWKSMVSILASMDNIDLVADPIFHLRYSRYYLS